MDKKSTSVSTSTLKALSVMRALKGHSLTGVSNGEISKQLNMPAPTVSRCLATLVEAGFALQLENGRYALSIKALEIAQAHANELARATDRINELNQRVMAASQQ